MRMNLLMVFKGFPQKRFQTARWKKSRHFIRKSNSSGLSSSPISPQCISHLSVSLFVCVTLEPHKKCEMWENLYSLAVSILPRKQLGTRGGVELGESRGEHRTWEHEKHSVKTWSAGFIKHEQADENDHPSRESAVAAVERLCRHAHTQHTQLLWGNDHPFTVVSCSLKAFFLRKWVAKIPVSSYFICFNRIKWMPLWAEGLNLEMVWLFAALHNIKSD